MHCAQTPPRKVDSPVEDLTRLEAGSAVSPENFGIDVGRRAGSQPARPGRCRRPTRECWTSSVIWKPEYRCRLIASLLIARKTLRGREYERGHALDHAQLGFGEPISRPLE